MWYPDTWISGYLDIQAFLAIQYPDSKKVEISKYPSIQVSMISKYPCIQVSGYIKNEISNYPCIQTLDSWIVSISKYPNPSIRILGYLDYFNSLFQILGRAYCDRVDFATSKPSTAIGQFMGRCQSSRLPISRTCNARGMYLNIFCLTGSVITRFNEIFYRMPVYNREQTIICLIKPRGTSIIKPYL